MSETWSETRDVWSGLIWFGPCPSSGIWPYLCEKA